MSYTNNSLGEKNEQFVGRTGGEIVISTPAKNLTTKKLVLLANLITTRQPASYSLGNMSTGAYDKTTTNTNSGAIAGQVLTNEQEPSGDISFGWEDDFIYIGKNLGNNTKNKLQALFAGEGFYNGLTDTDDVFVPVGTNGTDKTIGSQARPHEIGKDWKLIYENEGGKIKSGAIDGETGLPVMKNNPFSSALNREYKTICTEFMMVSGQGTIVNRMFSLLGKKEMDFTEGDVNSTSATFTKACDYTEREGYYWEKIQVPTSNTAKLTEFEVDHIVIAGATEPTTGATGSLMALVSANGTITFKKKGASTWEALDLSARIDRGTRIFARQILKSGAVATAGNVFVVVKSVVNGTATAVNFSLDSTAQHFIPVLLFNRDTCKYEAYVTPSEIAIARPNVATSK